MPELSDEAKAEIKAAVEILKSDGVHIHKTYSAFQKTLGEHANVAEKGGEVAGNAGESLGNAAEGEETPTEGSPPPEKQTPTEKAPKKKGLWWGEES